MEEAIDDLDSRLKIDGIVIIRKKIDKGGDYSEVGNQIFAMQIYFCTDNSKSPKSKQSSKLKGLSQMTSLSTYKEYLIHPSALTLSTPGLVQS